MRPFCVLDLSMRMHRRGSAAGMHCSLARLGLCPSRRPRSSLKARQEAGRCRSTRRFVRWGAAGKRSRASGTASSVPPSRPCAGHWRCTGVLVRPFGGRPMCGRPSCRKKIGDHFELGSFWGGRRLSKVWGPGKPPSLPVFSDWLAGPAALFVFQFPGVGGAGVCLPDDPWRF